MSREEQLQYIAFMLRELLERVKTERSREGLETDDGTRFHRCEFGYGQIKNWIKTLEDTQDFIEEPNHIGKDEYGLYIRSYS